MGSRIKSKNLIFGLLMLMGLLGSAFEIYQIFRIDQVNNLLRQGKPITDDHYLYQKKFSEAYKHGVEKEYKHAIQNYSQLLETAIPLKEQVRIQFNIGNNLFLSGLSRLSEDGKMKDDIKYNLLQAKVAYEEALRLEPSAQLAKFNLSLLLSILPQSPSSTPKDQSGMELSNLPIGLP